MVSISTIDPGQPCVMITGNAFSFGDLTWMKWMSRPSISVMKCGKAFSLASSLPKSYSVRQYSASACIVASGTPCDSSGTVSFSGQRVAAMRRRRSSISASEISIVKRRIALVSAGVSVVTLILISSVLENVGWPERDAETPRSDPSYAGTAARCGLLTGADIRLRNALTTAIHARKTNGGT